jgi:hypothetical protein
MLTVASYHNNDDDDDDDGNTPWANEYSRI